MTGKGSGRGGYRPGSGRKPGAANLKVRKAADEFAAAGTTPLDYFRGLLNGTEMFNEVKFEAAKAAAPYVHPRLAAIEHSGGVAVRNVLQAPAREKTAQDWSQGYAPKERPLQ